MARLAPTRPIMPSVACLFLAALLPLTGCDPKPTANAPDGPTAEVDDRPLVNQIVGKTSDRKSVAGRWLAVIINGPTTLPAVIVDIDPDAEPPVAIVDKSKFAQKWEIEGASVTDDSIRLDVVNQTIPQPIPVTLTAMLRDGRLDGETVTDTNIHADVQLVAWDGEEADLPGLPAPPTGFQKFELLTQQGASDETLTTFIEDHAGSPVLKTAYRVQLVNAAGGGRAPEGEAAPEAQEDDVVRERLAAFLDESAAWGPGNEARAAIAAASDLVVLKRLDAETVTQLSDRAESSGGDTLNTTLEYERRVLPLIASVREGDRLDDAEAFIEEQLTIRPFDPILKLLRTELVVQTETKADDLELLAELATLPDSRSDLERLESLFKEVRPPEGGSETKEEFGTRILAYLDEIYKKRTTSFRPQEKPELPEIDTDDGAVRRTALFEMFTGGACDPCVASDIAFDALTEVYDDEIIVVRYHQNIPGPDPLAAPIGQQRFKDYGGEGTPTLVLNGRNLNPENDPSLGGLYGGLAQSPIAYRLLDFFARQELRKSTPITIEAEGTVVELQEGTIAGNAIVLRVEAIDFPEELADKLGVEVFLVEKEIRMRMPNGILYHHNVVRQALGGARVSEKGKLGIYGPVELISTQIQLLRMAEMNGIALSPELKNEILDMDSLAMLCIVKNVENGEILQSRLVDVAGDPPSRDPLLMENISYMPDALKTYIEDRQIQRAEELKKSMQEGGEGEAADATDASAKADNPDEPDAEAMKDDETEMPPSSAAEPTDQPDKTGDGMPQKGEASSDAATEKSTENATEPAVSETTEPPATPDGESPSDEAAPGEAGDAPESE